MKITALPQIWIIVLMVGLSQLSETVYTPSLPSIANDFNTSPSNVEHTLTTYLAGFAIGVLFWGRLSDKVGRKPCIISGLLIFIIGCIGCYFSSNIYFLMFSRVIQAFGCSVGSVISQSIARDSFSGPDLSKVYATVGSSLAIFPAVGPVIGGIISEHFIWNDIFIFLSVFSFCLGTIVFFKLPETHHKERRVKISILDVLTKLIKDKNVVSCAIVIGSANGIIFSYFAEGSFYLIKLLGLTKKEYGFSFLFLASATMSGSLISKHLNFKYKTVDIIKYGLRIALFSTSTFVVIILTHYYYISIPAYILIVVTILCQMTTNLGLAMTMGNTLSLALTNYKWCIGTATSLFGFAYYCVCSTINLGMSELHNGTLLPMPLFFFSIVIMMLFISRGQGEKVDL